LSEHKDDGEIERIQSIPKGKWNYLSSKSLTINQGEVLSLQRVVGRTSITNAPIDETMFVKITTTQNDWGLMQTEYIGDAVALNMIKTTPDDNVTTKDDIKLNRLEIADVAKSRAKLHIESNESSFEMKPRHEKALTVMRSAFNQGEDILQTLQYGIRNARESRDFDRLVNDINNEVRNSGSVFASTTNKFVEFYNQIAQKTTDSAQVEDQEGVLFYVNK
jgi:hypothetical protein